MSAELAAAEGSSAWGMQGHLTCVQSCRGSYLRLTCPQASAHTHCFEDEQVCGHVQEPLVVQVSTIPKQVPCRYALFRG